MHSFKSIENFFDSLESQLLDFLAHNWSCVYKLQYISNLSFELMDLPTSLRNALDKKYLIFVYLVKFGQILFLGKGYDSVGTPLFTILANVT